MPATKQSQQAAAPVKPQENTRPQSRPKLLLPHAVVLHNDRVNGFDYAVDVLKKVFHYGGAKAFLLTLRAHCAGKSIIWSGSLEVAELKSEQVRACGPDPRKRKDGAAPLNTTIEPLPG